MELETTFNIPLICINNEIQRNIAMKLRNYRNSVINHLLIITDSALIVNGRIVFKAWSSC